jgi:neutral ceramidase
MEPPSSSRCQLYGSALHSLAVCSSELLRPAVAASPYLVNMGSYDKTGPAADISMMGYASAEQCATGIYFRASVSRCELIIAESASSALMPAWRRSL